VAKRKASPKRKSGPKRGPKRVQTESKKGPPPAIAKKSQAAVGVGLLRWALNSNQVGHWASDHRQEAEHFSGWNYVAITALMIQAYQAALEVYADQSPDAKMIRKGIRKTFGSISRYKALFGDSAKVDKPLPPTHPFVDLLMHPNPSQSGSMFLAEQIQQLQLTGTCWIWKIPNGLGRTCQRYVVPTAITQPVVPQEGLPNGGLMIQPWSLRYPVDPDGFSNLPGWPLVMGAIIPKERLQCIRWPHPFYKDDGLSPLAASSLWTDTAEQVDRSRWNKMKNQGDPSVIISPPDDTDPDEEELDAAATKLNLKYGGPESAGKIMIAKAGSVTALGTTPKDMGYCESFPQLRDAMLAIHGVTGIAAGITDGGSYAAFFAAIKQFTELRVQPLLSMLAEEDQRDLAPEFGSNLTIELNAAAIDDPAVLEATLNTDLKAGVRTVGEWRQLRGLPPFGDERDDKLVTGVPDPPPGMANDQPDEQRTGVHGAPRLNGAAKRNGNGRHKRRFEGAYP
jgi:phage portal protein BeeE